MNEKINSFRSLPYKNINIKKKCYFKKEGFTVK